MFDLPVINDYAEILGQSRPLLDLRSPGEYQQGAFPNSLNIPLMDNEERHQVGLCYKQKGQDAAIELGKQLVSGDILEQRQNAWIDFVKQYPDGAIYCFRGGLRSRSVQQLIFDQTGIRYPRIDGGYKAMRRFLINLIDQHQQPLMVVSGRTGSGKTRLLAELDNAVDLEGLANHRGSAFGNQIDPQPSQIDFENRLAVQLLKQAGHKHLVVEDEGAWIGSVNLPPSFIGRLRQAPLLLLQTEDKERLQISLQEYIKDMQKQFQQRDGDDGIEGLENYCRESFEKIRKRLGGLRFQQLSDAFDEAFCILRQSAQHHGFEPIISSLLQDYYDPMYDYQLASKRERIVFEGNKQAILNYLKTL